MNRYNEALKFGWKQYCSIECQKEAKSTFVVVKCNRIGCNNIVHRQKNQYDKYGRAYCSCSCSVKVSNLLRKKFKICTVCKQKYSGIRKYCSSKCIPKRASKYNKQNVLKFISDFVEANGRIPLKREMQNLYHPARIYFGTWNKAIEAVGLKSNPVLFAKKYVAKDGHRCDSLAEKIIDEWLSRRKIKHERNFPYTSKDKFTVDFKVGDYWIEFFGLSGELKRYDELKRKKLRLAKALKLKLIEVYPRDLFPKSCLEERLAIIL